MNTQPMQPRLRRRTLLAALAVGAAGRRAAAQTPAPEDPWPSLAAQIFAERKLQDGSAIVAIDAPYRAEDAALVPLSLRSLLLADDQRHIRSITLVIDGNPSPLAAVFSPGPASGMRSLSTRVRIDDYTNAHAVAELSDDQLYATARYVKAAGGCSAPAAKLEADAIPLGTMRFRQFPPAEDAAPGLREAQLMIRHPNYTGMQMDQVTRLYVPAHFVTKVRIWQGDDLLLAIEGGISLSENPAFRFDYRPNGAGSFRAELDDSEGKSFKQEWPAARA
ncbi:MAG TPA: quinoprotein dehydrogenase-associated SoxYZ-like carrier [Acetobacteraceae bacterium]|jgi:sulfur-oxidizing protein SoxY|nr:quinoprotein dehydrogenase-associated SoxYZ-like carrier [Acetobacteraceae bacterium]